MLSGILDEHKNKEKETETDNKLVGFYLALTALTDNLNISFVKHI